MIKSPWVWIHEKLTTGVHGAGAGTLLAAPLIAALNFAKFKAIAMCCDNGATLPSSPNIGQWFLHTPTGRKILYQYNDTAWIPIISFGSMTVYVDKTDGTDDQEHGTAVDGDAFQTIQYAVDCIPGCFCGNVIIYINNESYAETVTVRGKSPTGDYTILLQGTLPAASKSGTTDNEAVYNYEGAAAKYAILYDSGGFGADYENYLVLVNSTDYRIIDKMCYSMGYADGAHEPLPGEMIAEDVGGGVHTGAWGIVVYVTNAGGWGGAGTGVIYYVPIAGTFADEDDVDIMTDSATVGTADAFTVETDEGAVAQDLTKAALVGTLSATPTNHSYAIYGWGTDITDIIIEAGQKGVFIQDVELTASYSIYTYQGADTTLTRCKLVDGVHTLSVQVYNECYFDDTSILVSDVGGWTSVYRCKLEVTDDAGRALYIRDNANLWFMNGSIVDGAAGADKASYGMNLLRGALANMYCSSANGFVRVRNCDTGIYAQQGGMGTSAANVQYSNNGVDENGEAATFSLIA